MSEMATFNYVETVEIKGRGMLYLGPAPMDMADEHIGSFVTVDGLPRKIIGIERTSRLPRKGEPCGLLLAALTSPEPSTQERVGE